MRRKSLFSFAFYRDSLSRIKVVSAIFLVISVLSALGTGFIEYMRYYVSLQEGELATLAIRSLSNATGLGGLMIVLLTPILTLLVFSYLMKRCDSDYYEMLPISRRAMALSGMAAVFTVTVITLAVSFGAFMLVCIPCYGKSVVIDTERLLPELLAMLIGTVIAIAATTVAVSLSGTLATATGITITLLIVPRLITSLFNSTLTELNPSLIPGHVFPLFDMDTNLYFALIRGDVPDGELLPFIYSAILALVYIALAVRFYVRRNSEYATHRFASSAARHTTYLADSSLIATFAVSLAISDFAMIALALFIMIVAFIVYIVAEAVVSKRQKGFVRALALAPVIAAVSVVFLVGTLICNVALSRFTPTAEDIDEVYVIYDSGDLYGYNYIDYTKYVEMRAENIAISDPECSVIISEALSRDLDERDAHDYLRTAVKVGTGGVYTYRYVYLAEDEYSTITEYLATRDEYRELWLDVFEGGAYPTVYADSYTISGSAADRIADTLANEVREIGFERWYSMVMNANSEYSTLASIEYNVTVNGEIYVVSLDVPVELVKTAEKIETERKNAAEKELNELSDTLNNAINGSGSPVSVTVFYYSDDNYAYRDLLISADAQSREQVDTILALVTTDKIVYSDGYVSISIYDNSFFGGYNYYSFDVDDEMLDELFELLELE